MITHSKIHCTLWKRMHHYLQMIPPHHVIIISLMVHKIQTPLWTENQTLYHQWEIICKVNINIEMSLVILTYNTMTSIMVMHSLSETSTQHYYNKNYKNPYWYLHDPITTKSFQISSEMDIETMPHAMYFSGSNEAVTKIIMSHTRQ